MTERQRRAFLKRHPDVDSWSKFFASQRKLHNVGEAA
jgi:WhiB family transcriptional regulator, redox-sensing transcriptional regulator